MSSQMFSLKHYSLWTLPEDMWESLVVECLPDVQGTIESWTFVNERCKQKASNMTIWWMTSCGPIAWFI
jgi:hypothetical protein